VLSWRSGCRLTHAAGALTRPRRLDRSTASRYGKPTMKIGLGLATLLLLACGPNAAEREICEKAAARLGECMRELYPENFELTGGGEVVMDMRACVRDIAIYETCLDAADCTAMMACLEAEASARRGR
jgi:hypothetical protein